MNRRMFCAAAAMAALAPSARSAEPSSQLFRVFRNDWEIGTHRLDFAPDAAGTTVSISIDLSVGLGPITFYRYAHRNVERWVGGRLQHFESRTDEDGKILVARARRVGDVMQVEGIDGTLTVPGTTLPTTYWHPAMMRQSIWIDTQHGRLARCKVTRLGEERVEAAGRTVDAAKFKVQGDLKLELWYDDVRWVKLAFAGKDGSVIDYRLVSGGPAKVAVEA